MILRRVIGGPILSIIFLSAFLYMLAGVNWVLKKSTIRLEPAAISVGVSAVAENVVKASAPEINAKSAISVESSFGDFNNIVFEKNSNEQLPIASLTKLMTAIVVLDNYNLSDTWAVDEISNSQGSMELDVKLGDTLKVESFLDIMLIGSSNKSAYALAELVGVKKFVELMNQKARELELKSTFFADPTGLSPENISTASDLVKLAKNILMNYPKIAVISGLKELYVPDFGIIKNTDELLGEIPDIVCSKTGFTKAAQGCLLLVTRPEGYSPEDDKYLISVILGADDRFSEMKKLINWSNLICN